MIVNLTRNFSNWLKKSLKDPISWIWLQLDDDLNMNSDSDEFVEIYKKYLKYNSFDLEKTKHDLSSPIQSLYRDMKSVEMPADVRDHFQELISALSPKRKDILNVMKFVVDNSDLHSVHMIEILIKMFPLSDNILKKSIIYCLSDILYNSHSLMPGAWKLRNCIMNLFPYLVSHISFHSSTGNNSYSVLVDDVEYVLKIWLEWNIFTKPYIKGVFSTLYFDRRYAVNKKESTKKIMLVSKSPKLDGKLLDKEILSVISIWPIRSRKSTWRCWLEIKNLLETNCFHENKLRQDWINNNGIIVPPITIHGLSNFLHRISHLEAFDNTVI